VGGSIGPIQAVKGFGGQLAPARELAVKRNRDQRKVQPIHQAVTHPDRVGLLIGRQRQVELAARQVYAGCQVV